jgi:hexosaminidase
MRTFVLLLIVASVVSCSKPVVKDVAVIPQPAGIVNGTGAFSLNENTVIVAKGDALPVAEFLRGFLKKRTGLDLSIVPEGTKNAIVLSLEGAHTNGEGYHLKSSSKSVVITASSPAGLFYGVQTLRQLFPPEIESAVVKPEVEWNIPVVEINDQPRFPWRGMMLDCSRHFFDVSYIKSLLDQLAAHKINRFHWHLVDDQGWRIEIKKYPELTTTSAWRVDRENLHWNSRPPQKPDEKATYGGFYTQDEIREIVSYAAKLHIEIIPEIEMPAHVSCVFAAYPEYSCNGKKMAVLPGGVWPITDIYCAGNDKTFEFINDVLTEVIALFPSKYVHIGGDEATKTEWEKCPKCQVRMKKEGLKNEHELQSYFIKRVEKFLNDNGRTLIGWDEILEGGLAPQATVMSWRGFKGGIEAAKSGHDVIMTPTDFCYFDYYQGPKDLEPLAIGGNLTISKVYNFNPVPEELAVDEVKHILGGQANLWTEYVPTPDHSDYMTFPRLDAMAEVLWTAPENKNFADFQRRLNRQFERYENAGINYAKSSFNVSAASNFDKETKSVKLSLSAESMLGEILFTLDGNDPVAGSPKYSNPFEIKETTLVKAAQFKDGKMLGSVAAAQFFIHKAAGATVKYLQPYSERHKAQGEITLVNCTNGSKEITDGQWQGFEGNDVEVVIDLGKETEVKHIVSNFLQAPGSWVFLPSKVIYSLSVDGENFTVFSEIPNPVDINEGFKIQKFEGNIQGQARYVKVLAKSIGKCPDWHTGKGKPAWTFIDEVVVE